MRAVLRFFLIGLLSIPLLSKAESPTSSIDFAEYDNKSTGCAPLEVTLVPDLFWGADPYVGWEWDFGDGNTSTDYAPTHIYTVEGDFDVRLITTKGSGIRDTLVKKAFFKVHNSFNVNLGPDTTICSGAAIILDAALTGATYLWNDGSVTPQLETFNEGEYYVEVSKGGCVGKDTIYVTVGSLLAADFNWFTAPVCSPIPAEFTDMSQSCNGTVNQWKWDFGDGETSTIQNPVHNYAAPGEYTVVLTVRTNNGFLTSQSKTVTIDGQLSPQVDVGMDFTLCHDSTAVLDAGNSGDDYLWSTGETTPSISITGGQKYIVAVSKDGCTTIDSVTVADMPTVSASFKTQKLSSCLPVNMQFIDESTPCVGTITGYEWDFGDGQVSTDQHPQHGYNTAGDYNVVLKVYHSSGEVDDTTIVVNITPLALNVSLGADTTICTGEVLTLDAGYPGATYEWNTGENTQQILVAFDDVYAVKVTYGGCMATDTINVLTKQAATINYDYTIASECLPVQVSFEDKTTVACNQSITTWKWDFGDGTISTLQNPQHNYLSSDTFIVRLWVTTSKGGSSMSSKQIIIKNTSHSVALPEQLSVCRNTPIDVDAEVADAEYKWWPSAGVSDTAIRNPSISANETGWYHVNVKKCMVTATDSVYVIVDTLSKPTIIQDQNTLKASVAHSYQWYREGEPVHGAVNRTLSVDRRGYYTVKTFNSTGCDKESNKFFFLPVSGKEKDGEIRVKCSPNPSNGIINIILSKIPDKPAKVTVFDMRGARIFSTQVKDNVNAISGLRLTKGMYMVEVYYGTKRITLPVVVQ